jgi:hypothetical protein
MASLNKLAPLGALLVVCFASLGGTWVMGQGKGSHASFPANGILDDFNRANEDPLANGNWTKIGVSNHDPLELVSNAARRNTGGLIKSGSYFSGRTFTANQEVYLTISTKPGNGWWMDLFLRIQDGTINNLDCYAISINISSGTDTIQVTRKDDDANTSVGAAFSQEITNGDGVGASITGSTITVYYRSTALGAWTALGTRTDATYSGTSSIDFAGSENGGTWIADDFGGGSL